MTHRTLTAAATLAVALLLPLAQRAQVTATSSDYRATLQPLAVLPAEPDNLSLVDGRLYCHAAGVMLQAVRNGAAITGFVPDTSLSTLAPGADYVARHPANGDLYFTRRDKNGASRLYVSHTDSKRNKTSIKRIKLDDMNIVHPTFSTDGRVMVFASDGSRRSHGGYDLWYSILGSDGWGRPTNMGSRINSKGDETCPTISGEYLLFCSCWREASDSHRSIYATRLIARHPTGDTASMYPIGMQSVQPLPCPINSPASDNYAFVVDDAEHCSYWASTRNDGGPHRHIYSSTDPLEGTQLWGRVLDRSEHPLAGVTVALLLDGRTVCTARTDITGFYALHYHPERHYDIQFSRDGCFTTRTALATTRPGDEYLLADIQHNTVMDSLAIGRAIVYTDLYGPGADTALSRHGRELLQPIIAFLTDNPTYSVCLTLSSHATADSTFNRLLTARRLDALRRHLRGSLPPSVETSFVNSCAGAEGCTTADGLSRLYAVIRRGAK